MVAIALEAKQAWYGTPTKVHKELEQAREKQDRYLGVFKNQLKRYHTRHYEGKEDGRGEDFLENHYHDWISYITPRSNFENPKAKVSTKLPGTQGEIAKGLHAALNRWIKDNDLRSRLTSPLVDMQFNLGVMMVTQEPIPNARPIEGLNPDEPEVAGIPYSPRCYRIPQDQYCEDGLARHRDELRFQSHRCSRDKRLLLDEAKQFPERGWNADLIERLDTGDTNQDLGRDVRYESNRDEVVWDEVWVPELELDSFPDGTPAPKEGWREHGFHGTILTVPKDAPEGWQDSDWLRAPRPFYGPPTGPYVVFGVYEVPNKALPLAPLVVVEEQVRDLNAHVKVQSRSAADYKRIAIVSKTDPQITQKIKSLEHHYVAAIQGFKSDQVTQLELAGITDQMIAYTGIAQDRLHRNAHMDDARRGQTNPDATATATAEAAQASEIRMSWIEEQFVRGVTRLLEHVLWYLYHDNRVAYPLGAEAAEDFEMQEQLALTPEGDIVVLPPEPWYYGGTEPGAPPFSGLELEVEPFSMRRMDEALQQQNVLQAIGMVMELLPLMQVYGKAVDWKRVVNAIGESYNIPDFADFIDVDELLQQAPTLDPRLQSPVLMNPNTNTTWPTSGWGGMGAKAGTPVQPRQAQPSLGGRGLRPSSSSAPQAPSPAVPGGRPIGGNKAGQRALAGAGAG